MTMRIIGLAVAVVWTALAQEPVDPFDTVLVAYRLTPQEKSQLLFTDGVMSPFWPQWQGRG